MKEDEKVVVEDVEIIGETALALKCKVYGQEIWIPRSQIYEDESDAYEVGETGTLVITDFIAIEKGIV